MSGHVFAFCDRVVQSLEVLIWLGDACWCG